MFQLKDKIKVPVDLQDLCDAFEDYSLDHSYYLDLETGKIIFISEFMDTEEAEELNEKVEEGFGKRYISIPNESPEEGYENMEEFIETVKDLNLKEKLCIALDGRGAFRKFKNLLIDYPKERERWFKFKDGRLMERVKEWLEEEGIEVTGRNQSK